MKHLAAAVLFLLLIPVAVSAQDKPNFSGTWALDVARSSVTPSPERPLEPETLVVTQTEKELRFERRVAGETTKQVVLFDHPVITSDGPSGAIEGIRGSWKHDVLVLTGWAETRPPIPSLSPPSSPRLEPASILTWALIDGGKTLTVQGLAFRVWLEATGEKVTEEVRATWVYRKH
jgi:hypothetical protein